MKRKKIMKNLLIILSGTFISLMGHADIIRCGFTEPFVTSEYSTTTSVLTYVEDITGTKHSIRNVQFQIRGPGKFELIKKTGEVLQVLELNYQGSDGMSDFQYPYSVIDKSRVAGKLNQGGCTSNFFQEKDSDEE